MNESIQSVNRTNRPQKKVDFKILDSKDYGSTVRNNLMKQEGYAPYCMGVVRDDSEKGFHETSCATAMNRMVWNGQQFDCGCGSVTEFEDDFIQAYKDRWGDKERSPNDPITIMYHPNRYPKHDESGNGDKGQRWRGECNRTACKNTGSVHFHVNTYGYYCPVCAELFRRDSIVMLQLPVVRQVDHQLTREEMDELHAKFS